MFDMTTHSLVAPTWWHTSIWSIQCPHKNILLLWLNLAGKIHVWDHLSKFMGIGPSYCSLCQNYGDNINHIFINDPYIAEMWSYVSVIHGRTFIWVGHNFGEVIKEWLVNPVVLEYRDYHCFSYGEHG